VSTAAAVASVPAAAPSGTPVQTGRRVRLAALGKGLHLEGDRMLVVIPAWALGAAAVVAIPLAVRRRIAWTAMPLALVPSVVVGELIFQATLGTAFARRSAARHWTAVERRASAEREAEERAVCRRVMAERPTPAPPTPPGAVLSRSVPPEGAGSGAALLGYDRARCAALLKR
jgi:hypothetical protein